MTFFIIVVKSYMEVSSKTSDTLMYSWPITYLVLTISNCIRKRIINYPIHTKSVPHAHVHIYNTDNLNIILIHYGCTTIQ